MIRFALKGLRGRKLRLVLSGLAVVLGTMFVAGSLVLTNTLARSFDQLFDDVYAGTDVEVSSALRPGQAAGDSVVVDPVPASLVEQVKAVPGVAAARGSILVDGAAVVGRSGKVLSSGFGTPSFGGGYDPTDPTLTITDGTAPIKGQVLINKVVSSLEGYKVGDQIKVITLRPQQTFTVVGIVGYTSGKSSIAGEQLILFNEAEAGPLMVGKADVYSTITVTAKDGVDHNELKADVAARVGPAYSVKTGEELATESAGQLDEALGFFNYILLGFAGIALFVGIFLILNTFSIIVASRLKELALLKALGASRGQVVELVIVEAVSVGVVASVLGWASGVGIGAALAYLAGKFTGDLSLAGLGGVWTALGASLGVGVVITVLSALIPAVRASKIPPVAAFGESARDDRPLSKLGIAGGIGAALGVALLVAGLAGAGDATLILVLVGIVVFLIGVSLFTPLIAGPVTSMLGWPLARSVAGELGRRNTGRNPRRTAITAAALMIGVTLVTAISTLAGSASASLASTAEGQLKAQLIINGTQTAQTPPTFEPQTVPALRQAPGVTLFVPIWTDVARYQSKGTDVADQIVATDTAQGLLDISGGKLSAGKAPVGADEVMVDTNKAAELGLRVGSTLDVAFSKGSASTMVVSGTYIKTDLTSGLVFTSGVVERFRTPKPNIGLIEVTPGQEAAAKKAIEDLLVTSPQVNVMDRSEFVAQQRQQIDNVLVFIQILLALAMVVAVLGVVNTLVLSVMERTRELGMLRAVGLTRRNVMVMVSVESVVISLFGALLGCALGAGIGAAVVTALHDQGIRTLALPWGLMVTYLVAALFVGVVAGVLPSIRAARLDVLDAISYQ